MRRDSQFLCSIQETQMIKGSHEQSRKRHDIQLILKNPCQNGEKKHPERRKGSLKYSELYYTRVENSGHTQHLYSLTKDNTGMMKRYCNLTCASSSKDVGGREGSPHHHSDRPR